jgi:hypothetical protein
MKTHLQKREALAKSLSHVHASCLRGFYKSTNVLRNNFWKKLSKIRKNPEHVDKEFFRKIADYVITNFDLNNRDIDWFAKVLSQIHSKSLNGFYENETGEDFWRELKESSNDKDGVDRKFFRKIAVCLIKIMHL